MVGSKSDRVFSQKKGKTPQQQQQQQPTPSVKIVNPFDRKTNRLKHTVLGKKVAGTSGNRGQSRYNDIERRKKTLLVELNQSKKSNQFLDQRIAEHDPNMTEEDKMLARYQKEKMKKNLYNLNDEDDQLLQDGFGGLGDHLADDYVADENDELLEEEKMTGRRRRNEDGEEVDEDGEPIKKSREEIYQEIIEKSKQGRAERAKEKMLKDDITRELDEQFDEIRSGNMLTVRTKEDPLLSLFPDEDNKKSDNKNSTSSTGLPLFATENNNSNAAADQEDDYDQLVMEMAVDSRAKATDRTKTDEEKMKEEKERLDKLEENRLKRMRGEIVEEDEESAKKMTRWEKRQMKLTKGKTNLPTRPTADDLNDDDFALDDPLGNKDAPWYDGEEKDDDIQDGEEDDEEEDDDEDDEEEEDDEEGEDDEEEDGEDGEEVDDENVEDDDDELDEYDIEAEKIESEIRKINSQKKASEEIPFTFDVPKSIDELNQWLAGRTQEEKNTIYTRIRVCNHISIKPQNKEKMKVYLPVLWRRFELIAANAKNATDADSATSKLDWAELDLLSTYIFEVGKDVPEILAATALAMMHSCYKRSLGRIEKANAETITAWPSISEMLTMKLIANVFPTSDYQHQVITPATVAMAHFLIQLPIITPHDILSSIFLSNIFKYYLISAKKYAPEISAVIISLISSFSQQNQAKKTKEEESQWASFNRGILVPNVMLKEKCLTFSNKKNLAKITPATLFDFNTFIKSKQEQSLKYFETDQFRIDLLYLLLNFVESYIQQITLSDNSESLPSILQLFLNQLNQFDTKIFNQIVQDKFKLVKDLISGKIKSITENRVPLTLLVGKPVEKKTFTPSFSQEYKEHGDDPDVVRQEARKMKALHKKEMKGAMRELIKDNMFIQQEKAKARMEDRADTEQKRKKIMAELEQEQHEHKQYKKMKDRLDGRI